MSDSVSAIVVSFRDPAATAGAVRSLLEQSLAPVELLILDNDPRGSTAQRSTLAEMPRVRILHPGTNLGYTGAANLAAQQAVGDWLFFLNPDAMAAGDCLERLLEAVDGPEVAIVGAQVLLPDGRINAGENPINIAGICWSGRYGEPREHGQARDVGAVSGAAMLVRRETFLELDGMCPFFFMYMDDSDLAWRIRLRGMRVRYCPEAVVVHEYEFEKGPYKWFYLERNRGWALLSNLQLRTLVFLTPVLLATEVVVLIRAVCEGWLTEKARAWLSLIQQFPQLARWRRSVQGARVVSDYQVLELFRGGIETDLIATRLPRWVNLAAESYRRALLRTLQVTERALAALRRRQV
ncbi:MAG: glycosyltransferase family 2 protein [Solirubrobacterales bacterium]|nr:glycosyltransferase family 2 protein [Solirubrobacterales bacterium]